MVKKGSEVSTNLMGRNALIGFVVGVLLGLLIGYFIFGAGASYVGIDSCSFESLSSSCSSGGNEEVSFTVEDVHLKTNEDFEGNEMPFYDSNYCAEKYSERFGKEADYCILEVEAFLKQNPLAKDVNCVCWG
jgi:hypothetical protein